MTVTANTTRNDYVGNGQSVYSYTFQLNDASDVTVYLDGVVQTLNTHYTVENVGVGSGGTITFTLVDENNDPIHPTSSNAISIVMAMDLDRDTNYQQSGLFAASDVNNDFDRLWLASNQQQTAINRSLRLQDDDATTGNMELPSKDDRKGKLLGFNATTGLPETLDNNNSNWNAAYNNMITSASFSGGNYTLTQQDGGTISTSLDGRYHKIGTDIPDADISQASVTQHQGALSITESQISDLGSYLPLSGGTLTGDVEFGANKAKFVGLEIYNTVGNTSVIEETGAGNLNIKGQDVRIQTPTNEDIIKGEADGAVTLYYDNNAKLATTNTGISVTGTLSATGYNDNNWNTAYNDKINSVNFTSADNTLTLTQQDGTTLTTVINGSLTGGGETLAQTLAIGNTTGGNDISFGDNDKAKFGASDDLQIFHTGSYSAIRDVGTGGLFIGGENYVDIGNAGASETYARFHKDAQVDLYHNNSVKLATTSTGIDVTGTATMDGLTVGDGHTIGDDNFDNLLIQASSGEGIRLIDNHATNPLNVESNVGLVSKTLLGTNRFFVDNSTGDISFYEDTGTTPKFFWDASAERLGIGTSSPAANLHVDASAPEFRLSQSGTAKVRFRTTGDNYINTGQNLGIGTSSPSRSLDVQKSTIGDVASFRGSNAARELVITSSTTTSTGDTYTLNANSGNGVIAIATGSTERMRINSSGNVGIGTTSPEKKLHVEGDVRIKSAFPRLYLTDTDSNSDYSIINNNGKFSIYDDTNTDYRMVIDSSGNVGIGVTGPTGKVQIYKGGQSSYQTYTATNSGLILQSYQSQGNPYTKTSDIVAGSDGTVPSEIRLLTRTAGQSSVDERMRIDSSGNVGIGTTSPSGKLEVSSADFDTLYLTRSTAGSATILMKNSSNNGGLVQSLGNGGLSFFSTVSNSSSERMRIDSSGNLLVGKTSLGLANVGCELRPDGQITGTRTSSVVGVFNRLSTDGEICNFYKDGSTVGSIGTTAGRLFIGNGDVALRLAGDLDFIAPWNASTNAARDNAISLGNAGNRFKDLYLSGSINASGLTYPTSDGTANQVMVTDGSGNLSFASRSLWASGGLSYTGSSNVIVSQNNPTGNTSTAKLNVFKGNSNITPDANSTVFLDSSGSNTLQMGTGTYSQGSIYFGNSWSNKRAGIEVSHGGGSMAFRNYGIEAMRLNSSGHLCIGNTSPSCRLTVQAAGGYAGSPSGTIIQGRNTVGDAYAQLVSNNFGSAGIYFGDSSDNDRAGVIYSNYSDRLDFRASGATKMSIISAGYVGINTTAPTAPLDINGNKLRIRDSFTPSSATATGSKGEICYDTNYMYVCVATNTWKRAALASW